MATHKGGKKPVKITTHKTRSAETGKFAKGRAAETTPQPQETGGGKKKKKKR